MSGCLKLFYFSALLLSFVVAGNAAVPEESDWIYDDEMGGFLCATAVDGIAYETNELSGTPIPTFLNTAADRKLQLGGPCNNCTLTRVDGIDFRMPCRTAFANGAKYIIQGGLWCSAHQSQRLTRRAVQIQLLADGRIKHAFQIASTSNDTGHFEVYDQAPDYSKSEVANYRFWPFAVPNLPLPTWGFDDLYPWMDMDSPNNITIVVENMGADGYKVTVDNNTMDEFWIDPIGSFPGTHYSPDETDIDQIKVTCLVKDRSFLWIDRIAGVGSPCPLPSTTTTAIIGGGGLGPTTTQTYWGMVGLLGAGAMLLLWLLIMAGIYTLKSHEAIAINDDIEDVSFMGEMDVAAIAAAPMATEQADGAGLVELDPDNSFWVA
eukprot:Selendium_serpulae@DN6341_c0_g1_i5.p1